MDVTDNDVDVADIEAFAQLDAAPAPEKKRKPAPQVEDETTDTTDTPEDDTETTSDDDAAEGDEETSTDESEEEEGEEAEGDKTDELVVKVKVDGEEREFTVASLKRLAGQEAALTRRSQEVATQRQQIEQTAKVHVAALDKMLERAKANYEPYAQLDFLALSRDPNVSTEQLTALRDMATKAYEDVKFIEQDLAHFSKEHAEREHAELIAEAKKSLEILRDPEKGIPGFNETVYAEMRQYALDIGIPAQAIDRTVDATSLKLLHKAMLYDRGQKKVTTTKTDKKVPKKIVKSTSTPDAARKIAKDTAEKKAFKRLEQTHSMDDAVDAFAERFAPRRSDD